MVMNITMPKQKANEPARRPPAVTAQEAADRLGVTRMSITRYMQQGKLRGYRKGIGRAEVYVYIDSLEEFERLQEINPE